MTITVKHLLVPAHDRKTSAPPILATTRRAS